MNNVTLSDHAGWVARANAVTINAGLFIRYVWRRFANRIRMAVLGPAAKPQ